MFCTSDDHFNAYSKEEKKFILLCLACYGDDSKIVILFNDRFEAVINSGLILMMNIDYEEHHCIKDSELIEYFHKQRRDADEYFEQVLEILYGAHY